MSHRFVELAIGVDDVLAARADLLALGFSECSVGDAWHHPYTCMQLDRLAIGLHQQLIDQPTIVLARHQLAASLRRSDSLESWQRVQLDDDAFNYALRCEGDEHPLLLVEASTHSWIPTEAAAPMRWREYRTVSSSFTESALFWAPFAQSTLALDETAPAQIRLDVGGMPLTIAEAPDNTPPTIILEVMQPAELITSLARHGFSLSSSPIAGSFGRLNLAGGLHFEMMANGQGQDSGDFAV